VEALSLSPGPAWIASPAFAGLVVALVVIPVLIGLARAAAGVGADFAIRYRPRAGTTVRGRVPRAKVGAIAAFFDRDLRPDASVVVRGAWGPGRVLRLRFSGRLTPAQQQRARNFLVDHLR
jgi:hypothetical protein